MDAHGGAGDRVDRRLRALAHADRRALLDALAADDYQRRSPTMVDDSGTLDLEASVTELHHRHLPMLSDLELVSWRSEPLAVVRGPQFHEIEPLLEHISTTWGDCSASAP